MNRSLLSVSLLVLSLGLAQADDIDLNNGLIGYWPLNGNALDYSGNGYDGILLPNASFVNDPAGNGEVLQTFPGDVNEGYVQVDLPISVYPEHLSTGTTSSGSCWARFDNFVVNPAEPIATRIGILSKVPYINQVTWRNDNQLFAAFPSQQSDGTYSNYYPKSGTNSINTINTWYHISWTSLTNGYGENGYFRWYINGVLAAEYTISLTAGTTYTPFSIGGSHASLASSIKIAEVRLYDRILTEDEIAALADINNMRGTQLGFAWDATSIPTGNAPFTVDPSSLALELTNAYGIPLSSYEDSSRIPDLYYTIVSGPAIHNANGDIEFLGGGDVVLKLETPGNAYYAATSQEVTVSANGTAFNNALWDNERGTGFFITDNAEAGVATLGEEAVRIDVDGNVGIGVTQPQAALDVNGNTQVSGSLQAANGIVKVTESGDLVINEGQSNEIRLGADGSAHFPKYGDIKMLGEE